MTGKDPTDLIAFIDDLFDCVKHHPVAMKQYPELQIAMLEIRQLAKQRLNECLGRVPKRE